LAIITIIYLFALFLCYAASTVGFFFENCGPKISRLTQRLRRNQCKNCRQQCSPVPTRQTAFLVDEKQRRRSPSGNCHRRYRCRHSRDDAESRCQRRRLPAGRRCSGRRRSRIRKRRRVRVRVRLLWFVEIATNAASDSGKAVVPPGRTPVGVGARVGRRTVRRVQSARVARPELRTAKQVTRPVAPFVFAFRGRTREIESRTMEGGSLGTG